MTPWTRVALCGAAAVVILDTVASLVSNMTGIPYSSAVIGSVIIQVMVGYLAARTTQSNPLIAAARSGIVLGVTDASIGWAVSWAMGPGRWVVKLTPGRWIATAAFVTVLATLTATLGGLVAQWRNRTTTPAAT